MQELYTKAEQLAGRPVEVVQTTDGKFVVEWFRADMPPPKADTKEDALLKFVELMLRTQADQPNLELEDTQ